MPNLIELLKNKKNQTKMYPKYDFAMYYRLNSWPFPKVIKGFYLFSSIC